MNRSYLRISGDDRISFLQGILTQDVAKLAEQKIQFAALLSPQGKVVADMFLVDQGDSILLDTGNDQFDSLKKRLTMYKLRAKVTIEPADAPATALPDPRHPELPPHGTVDEARRIRLAIPELGHDFAPDSITAMDAGYDLLNGISFTKGCYVGQEVTARMHYKNIARKGFFRVQSAEPLTVGAGITSDGRAIGSITSVNGNDGLAFLKFEDALSATPLVENHPVAIRAPGWMQPKLDQFQQMQEKE